MKKLFAILIIPAFSLFIACSGSLKKTGNDQPDTGSKHGASGPANAPNSSAASDTINGSAAPFAETTAGTDTSTDGLSTDNPLVDTARPKPVKGTAKKHH